MKYVWILMLVALDVGWLLPSIADVIFVVKYVKKNERYHGVGDFINRVVNQLKDSTIAFVAFHIFALSIVLFIASFIMWVYY